jgi:23S rRNA G2069 N7-methylase RlmK/C1962 C5-methylase RlmI
MNAYLNDCGDKVKFVRDDISKFMKEAETQGDSFNVIILDPPKLAPSISGLDRAKRKYHGLNRDALKLIDTKLGGLLMTCTCSAAMTQQNGGQYFLNMVQQAAIAAGRHITLLKVSGAAPCHSQSPASFPAGNYLTAAIFYVAPL